MIWIDLDNTLIYSPDALDRLADRIAGARCEPSVERFENVLVEGASRGACARHKALEFLATLRELAPVRLLTTATRRYASAMNTCFGLGFTPDVIVAREDWMDFPPPFTQTYRPRSVDVDPSGVLVDDDDESIHCRMKLAYLGTRSLVTVPSYRGCRSDPFVQEWSELVSRVRRAISQTGHDCQR
jgi:hypothetical protein